MENIVDKIISLRGKYNDNVVKGTDYLIIGDKNNHCSRVFSYYGTKLQDL